MTAHSQEPRVVFGPPPGWWLKWFLVFACCYFGAHFLLWLLKASL